MESASPSVAIIRRHIWRSVFVVAVVVYGGSLCTFATAQSTAGFRIVTFNAQFLTAPQARGGTIQRFRFSPAREAHLERVAGIIEALEPDVLALVEVTSKEAVDGLIHILHEKGLTDYQGFHVESGDTFTELDVAFLSRLSLDEVEGKTIRTYFSQNPGEPWREPFTVIGQRGDTLNRTTSISRNAVCFLTVGQHRFGLIGLHLSSNPEGTYPNARSTAEAKIAQRIIRKEVVARGYLPIVLGDLNDYDPDVPDRDDTRSALTTVMRDIKDYDPDEPGPELVNAARKIVRKEDRYTSHWDFNENGAADSDDVYTMIDHILLPRELMPYVHRVFIARVLDLTTSDHFPVVVDLRLPLDAQ